MGATRGEKVHLSRRRATAAAAASPIGKAQKTAVVASAEWLKSHAKGSGIMSSLKSETISDAFPASSP